MMAVMATMQLTAQTEFRDITLEQALQTAKTENKLVFIDFYTDWCGPCKMMASKVFPQKEVGDYFNAKFVCIKLNAEKEDRNGKALAKQFKIMAYPTFIGLDADGKEVMRREGGTQDAQQFVNEIEAMINPELAPQKVVERYGKGERDPKLVSAYSNMLMEQSHKGRTIDHEKEAEARKVVNDYFLSLDDGQRMADDNTFMYNIQYLGGKDDPKVEFLNKHFAEFRKQPAKADVVRSIEIYYIMQMQDFIGCKKPFVKEEYDEVKSRINNLGMNDDHKYDAAFKMIEAHAKGDMDKYLKVAEKVFPNVPEGLQQTVIENMGKILGDSPEMTRKGIAFIRKAYGYVDATTIYFTARKLMQMEQSLQNGR